MTTRVETIETIVTQTEVEALHLEQNLVKRHRPPFNVRLRDDKAPPHLALTAEDDPPRVMLTRERHRRGLEHFGPSADAPPRRAAFHLENAAGEELGEVLEQFCLEYYGAAPSIPPQILVPRGSGDTSALELFLSERRGSHVEVRAPERGEKRRVQELAQQNAQLALESETFVAESRRLRRVEALEELREVLNLESLPIRIECFDISNIQGQEVVGSMVVFEDGVAEKS